LRFGDGHTLLWSLERGLDCTSLWSTFEHCLQNGLTTDVLDMGVMLPCCEALRQPAKESSIWHLIGFTTPLRRDVQEIVAGVTGHERNPAAYIDKHSIGADLLGAQVNRHGGHAQHKLAMLV